MGTRGFRLAAIQIDSKPGQVQANLEHATGLVRSAAGQGAELVLLPELMPSGYLLNEAIWDCAEPEDGPSTSWLTSLAEELGIYLGTSFLEVEGEDFYNTFILAEPDGRLAGRVRKCPPASFEAHFYRAGTGPHILETGLGRVGVGICYENLLYEHLIDLYEAPVDLVLLPTAAGKPVPQKPGDIQAFDKMIGRTAARYARVLDAPAMLANRVGEIHAVLPGKWGEYHSRFSGRSTIADRGGTVKARLGEEEGIIVADVHLGQEKKGPRPRCYGKMWSMPMPWYVPVWPYTQHEGELAYAQNERRREKAISLSRPS